MNKFILDTISKAVKMQQVSYNNGHENQGASIDVLAEIQKTCMVNKFRGMIEAGNLIIMIHQSEHFEALKYAKPLSFKTKSFIRNAVQAYVFKK